MDSALILILIFLFISFFLVLPVLGPFVFSIIYRKKRIPPAYAPACLLLSGSSALILLQVPSVQGTLFNSSLIGCILSFIVFTAFFLKITTRLSVRWTYIIPVTIFLLLCLWIDRRLTVFVVNPMGEPTDVTGGSFTQPGDPSLWSRGHTGFRRVDKGVYHLGVINWTRLRFQWPIYDQINDASGHNWLRLRYTLAPTIVDWPVTLKLQPSRTN